jgi:chromosome segregation ATPase
MLNELNLLENKLNNLIDTMEALKKENGDLKPNLHHAKEEIQMLKTKINEATLKIENLLAQLPS